MDENMEVGGAGRFAIGFHREELLSNMGGMKSEFLLLLGK